MHDKALEILKEIEKYGYKAYIVGGYVRDYCMSLSSFDIDICTNAKPKELIKIFSDAILPNDIYGSVTLKYKGVRFEITTFRKELKYENRKPIELEYIDDLKEDLKRRDFTINSLCMTSNGEIIDLFNGRNDINKRIIRCLGDAKIKFFEDPFRILRAIRFSTTLNFKLDKEVIEGIKENMKYLKNISYDRKKSELNKIFGSSNSKHGIKLLLNLGIDKYLDINLNKVKPTTDILGIWAQLDAENYNFTKNEKEIIDDVKAIVRNKTISRYEIYKYGLYKTIIAAEILGINRNVIVRLDRSLKIRTKKDIHITTDEIVKLLNKKPDSWISDLYDDLERKIVGLKLKNEKEIIKDYILKKYIK